MCLHQRAARVALKDAVGASGGALGRRAGPHLAVLLQALLQEEEGRGGLASSSVLNGRRGALDTPLIRRIGALAVQFYDVVCQQQLRDLCVQLCVPFVRFSRL